ncbi:MAG: type II toxin-antitoxin system YafQ family toxin [Lachnospiraceae bacterium]|nr:type II toxin-antitoxin system YafQ family toxin [Clostridiales bacterium]MBR6850279.1 type II toxin-antitoxin system YafQ family toxin [Lachnospiraceae bacterium]
MKYEIKVTSKFKKDLKLAKKQKKNIDLLFEVIDKLAKGKKLEDKFRDHELSGNFAGIRECHVESDWLLMYEIRENTLVLLLYRVGSHSELFE